MPITTEHLSALRAYERLRRTGSSETDVEAGLPVLTGRPANRVFDVQLAELDSGSVACRNGVSLQPSITAADEGSHDDVLVHQVQQDIDLHLGGPLRVSDLASRFGLSERALSRRFTAATGRGPQAYRQHARVQQAMRLLETTGNPVERIRGRVGYTDPAAFRRAFKQATGLSPGGYGPSNGPGG